MVQDKNNAQANDWNACIGAQITHLYAIRTNVKILIKNDGTIEEILDPTLSTLIRKLESLRR
jgi:hypothetical protein